MDTCTHLYTHTHTHINTHTHTCVYTYMRKIKIKSRIIYNLWIYPWMIIATTVAISTITTKESDAKSQIRSKTDKIVPTFLISNLSQQAYWHYHNHHHHHYHHFYYYYYHYNTNNFLCLCLNIYIYNNKRTGEKNKGVLLECL